MVWFLARHEWRLLAASRIARLVIAVFAIAVLAASALGAARTWREQTVVASFEQRAIRERAQPVSRRADVAANERGWLALLPPAPLSALAIGQGDV